jgi:hypothetical protein
VSLSPLRSNEPASEQLEAFARAYVAEHGIFRTRQMLRAGDRAVLSRLVQACRTRRAPRFIRGRSAVRRRARTGARGDPEPEPPAPLGGLLVRSGVAA